MPQGIGYELGQLATGQRKGAPVGQAVAVDPFAPIQAQQPAQAAARQQRRRRPERKISAVKKERMRRRAEANKLRIMQKKKASVAQNLFGGLVYGTDLPGEGMIPFASLPEDVRKGVKLPAPPIGWNPDKLGDQELALLQALMRRSETERGANTLRPNEIGMLQNGG